MHILCGCGVSAPARAEGAGVTCWLVKLQMDSGGDEFPAGTKGCAFQEALLKKTRRAKVAL